MEEKKKSELYAEQAEADRKAMQPVLDDLQATLSKVRGELDRYGKFAASVFSFAKNKVSGKAWEGIEAVQDDFVEKKKVVDERYEMFKGVGETSRKQTAKINDTRGKQDGQADSFAQTQDERSSSEVLGKAARVEGVMSKGRTLLGSVAAKVAKQPQTFAARWAAIKGDKDAVAAHMSKADGIASKVMKATQTTNKKNQMRVQRRITSFNKVEDRSFNQGNAIENATVRADDRTEAFVEKHAESSQRRSLTAKGLGKLGSLRTFSGNIRAQVAQISYDTAAKVNAVLGRDEAAQRISKRGGEVSRDITSQASSRNTQMYGEFDRRVASYDKVRSAVGAKVESLDGLEEQAADKTSAWEKAQTSQGFTTRAGIKLTKGITKVVTGATRLYAEGDMKITGLAAKVAALTGHAAQGQKMVRDAKKRTTDNMRGAEKVNKSVRTNATRAFNFKDRKKQEAIELGGKIASGIETGVGYAVGAITATGQVIGDAAIETGKAIGKAAKEGKKQVLLAQSKVAERYNGAKKTFFTRLKEGPATLLHTLTGSLVNGLDERAAEADKKQLLAAQKGQRIANDQEEPSLG